MNTNTAKIKISRSEYIERDRNIAVLRVVNREFLAGEPVMVRYYEDSEQTKVNALFAIGIKTGQGQDCYKILSLSGLKVVRDVVTELPDVSALVHEELYLYQDPDKVWNYVYLGPGDSRVIEPILDGPYVFSNSNDNSTWYFVDGVLRREGDFYTRSEVDTAIKNTSNSILDYVNTTLEGYVTKDYLVTEDHPGLISSEDKARLDYLYSRDPEIADREEVQGMIDTASKELQDQIDNIGSTIEGDYVKKTDLVTHEENGLMRKEDKVFLDDIASGNKPLPSPVISGSWSFYNYNEEGITLEGLDSKNPIVENGYKASFSGTYSWTHEEGKKDPTQVQSGSNWNDLPDTGIQSEIYQSPVISSDSIIKIGIQAEKTGLMVSGSNVLPATGLDTASDSVSISFRHRLYWGNTSDSGDINITALSGTSLSTTKSRTILGVSTSKSEYFIYSYPKSLGKLSTIIQDGATPVLGAFTERVVEITNSAGLLIEMYVYTSNNPGAFSGVTLEFK